MMHDSWAVMARQDMPVITKTSDSAADPTADDTPSCVTSLADMSHLNLRIASIFVIFVGSALGAILPVCLARYSKIKGFKAFFFVAKYFGSGVILATAFMHLLSPASDNLRDACLTQILPKYDWAMLIALMTVMLMFLVELLVSRFDFGSGHDHAGKNNEGTGSGNGTRRATNGDADVSRTRQGSDLETNKDQASPSTTPSRADDVSLRRGLPEHVHLPGGEEHLCHQHDHDEGDSYAEYAAQMTSIFILEFGVIFHSIFIGLTLAITEEFMVLFVVLVFHQTFEGLGLGSRLAVAKWPQNGLRKWSPYFLGLGYAVSTPIAIAVGLGVRESLSLNGATGKIVNGVFDAVSGGILLYTGLVELLAHEFMFNPDMRKAGLRTQLNAYACVAVGVALMALLAKWA